MSCFDYDPSIPDNCEDVNTGGCTTWSVRSLSCLSLLDALLMTICLLYSTDSMRPKCLWLYNTGALQYAVDCIATDADVTQTISYSNCLQPSPALSPTTPVPAPSTTNFPTGYPFSPYATPPGGVPTNVASPTATALLQSPGQSNGTGNSMTTGTPLDAGQITGIAIGSAALLLLVGILLLLWRYRSRRNPNAPHTYPNPNGQPKLSWLSRVRRRPVPISTTAPSSPVFPTHEKTTQPTAPVEVANTEVPTPEADGRGVAKADGIVSSGPSTATLISSPSSKFMGSSPQTSPPLHCAADWQNKRMNQGPSVESAISRPRSPPRNGVASHGSGFSAAAFHFPAEPEQGSLQVPTYTPYRPATSNGSAAEATELPSDPKSPNNTVAPGNSIGSATDDARRSNEQAAGLSAATGFLSHTGFIGGGGYLTPEAALSDGYRESGPVSRNSQGGSVAIAATAGHDATTIGEKAGDGDRKGE